jgi:hypothetical protein
MVRNGAEGATWQSDPVRRLHVRKQGLQDLEHRDCGQTGEAGQAPPWLWRLTMSSSRKVERNRPDGFSAQHI